MTVAHSVDLLVACAQDAMEAFASATKVALAITAMSPWKKITRTKTSTFHFKKSS
jgi:hypothetical protein